MTRQILEYLALLRDAYLAQPGRVLEVGALNVNGSPREVFETLATEYIGTDMQAGLGVDRVVNNADLYTTFKFDSFDTIICCECLEHDISFERTVNQMHDLLKPGGHLVITTPTFGFPLHRYPKDFWRFGEDAYREVFYPERWFELLHLRILDSDAGAQSTIGAVGRRR